jgi:hypothetical protein
MFKSATAIAMVGVSLCLLHTPRASVPQSFQQFPDTNVGQETTGADLAVKTGTATVPTSPPRRVVGPGQQAEAQTEEDAEYQAERRVCESLTGDARSHCLEYAKLRYRRW